MFDFGWHFQCLGFRFRLGKRLSLGHESRVQKVCETTSTLKDNARFGTILTQIWQLISRKKDFFLIEWKWNFVGSLLSQLNWLIFSHKVGPLVNDVSLGKMCLQLTVRFSQFYFCFICIIAGTLTEKRENFSQSGNYLC